MGRDSYQGLSYTPTASSTAYSAPFTVTDGTTVKARAYRPGLQESEVYSVTFTFVPPATLTHRWPFNGTTVSEYPADSVGNAPASTFDNGTLAVTDRIRVTGGQNMTAAMAVTHRDINIIFWEPPALFFARVYGILFPIPMGDGLTDSQIGVYADWAVPCKLEQ